MNQQPHCRRPSAATETPRPTNDRDTFDCHGIESTAFNRGCDARLAGLPLDANPYRGDHGVGNLKRKWDQGWSDVNRWWGLVLRQSTNPLTRARIPHLRPLPPVQGEKDGWARLEEAVEEVYVADLAALDRMRALADPPDGQPKGAPLSQQ